MDKKTQIQEYDTDYNTTLIFRNHDSYEYIEAIPDSITKIDSQYRSPPLRIATYNEDYKKSDKIELIPYSEISSDICEDREDFEYLNIQDSSCYKEGFNFVDGELIYHTSSGSKFKVANYYFKKIIENENYNLDNNSLLKTITISVVNTLENSHTLKIPIADYYKLGEILRQRYPECTVYPHQSTNFNEYLKHMYLYYKKESDRTYTGTGGWRYLNNSWLYFHSNGISNESDRYLYQNKDSALSFLKYFDNAINKDSIKTILLLYLLWAHTSKLWKNITNIIGPQAILWIVGYTNSGKSTIAKALSGTLYEDPNSALMQFEGTEAAIDALLKDNQEQLICIDDFYPTYGEKKNDFTNKVNHLIRIVGDGQLKAKCTQNSKLIKGREYYGGVIVTGESFNIQNQSSLTRCIVVSLTQTDINKNRELAKLSNTPKIVNAFITEWIYWLTENQSTLKKSIKKSQEKYLDEKKSSKNIARYNTLKISFHILADLVEMFLKDTFNTYPNFLQNIHDELNRVLDEQREYQKQLDPVEICKNVLIEAIESGQINVSQSKEDFIQSKTANAYIEHIDNEEYLVITHLAFKSAFNIYAKDEGKALLFTSIKQHLVKDGFMKNASNIRGTRFSVNRLASIPKRPWIIHIKKSILGRDYEYTHNF